ncbi:MAG TPA: hypothetical protein VKT32_14125, partial [Chthonomonadaceae bacterium]|nr:hypothetical protein [Chthonomonadaceae bacterium]
MRRRQLSQEPTQEAIPASAPIVAQSVENTVAPPSSEEIREFHEGLVRISETSSPGWDVSSLLIATLAFLPL